MGSRNPPKIDNYLGEASKCEILDELDLKLCWDLHGALVLVWSSVLVMGSGIVAICFDFKSQWQNMSNSKLTEFISLTSESDTGK